MIPVDKSAPEPVSFEPPHVPSSSESGLFSRTPHESELSIQRCLQNHPSLRFSSLRVYRTASGVCLDGFLESNEEAIDLVDLVHQAVGPVPVVNHVLTACPLPQK